MLPLQTIPYFSQQRLCYTSVLCSTLTKSSETTSGLAASNSNPNTSSASILSTHLVLPILSRSNTISQTSFVMSYISNRTPDHNASIAAFAAFSSRACLCSGVALGFDSAVCSATKIDLMEYALRTVEKMVDRVLYVDPHDVRRALIEFPHDEPDRSGCVVAFILYTYPTAYCQLERNLKRKGVHVVFPPRIFHF